MILSDQDIKNSLLDGSLKIEPSSDKSISPASYVFHLGYQLLFPMGSDLIDFKLNLLPEYQEINITDEDGFTLNPEGFVLAQTIEKLTLSPSIAMAIEGRTQLARVGVEIVQTSTFIEPDHENSIITLEIKNNGKSPFRLYPQMPIAKGVFHQLSSPATFKYKKSSFTTQSEVKPPKVLDYFN